MPQAAAKHNPHPNRPQGRQDFRKSSRERGYDWQWEKVRNSFVAMPGNQICADCWEQEGIVVLMDEVDHVIPVKIRPDLRLSYENLRSLCKRHHRLKTLDDQKKYGHQLNG